MKKRHEFRPSAIDALEERLVLSHAFVPFGWGAPFLTGRAFSRAEVTNLRTLNRVVADVNNAMNAFSADYLRRYQAAVVSEQINRNPFAVAALDTATNAQVFGPYGTGGLQARLRNAVSRLPYGARELYANAINVGIAGFVQNQLNLGARGTTFGTTYAGQQALLAQARALLIGVVQNYVFNRGLPGRGADVGTPLFAVR